jgi:hypothetical protein
MKYIALGALALFLAGCGKLHVVVLQHPQTGQTVECKSDLKIVPASAPLKACLKAYEQAGYKITGDTR